MPLLVSCNNAVMSNSNMANETIGYNEEGVVVSIKGKNLSFGLDRNSEFRDLKAENRYDYIAYAFLESRKAILKVKNPKKEFKIVSEKIDDLGLKHIKFQQVYREIPIWGKEASVHLDEDNRVYMYQGNAVPTIEKLKDQPLVSEKEAVEFAKQHAFKENMRHEVNGSMLYIYMLEGSVPRLSYKVTLVKGLSDREHYFVDALDGKILHKITGIQY